MSKPAASLDEVIQNSTTVKQQQQQQSHDNNVVVAEAPVAAAAAGIPEAAPAAAPEVVKTQPLRGCNVVRVAVGEELAKGQPIAAGDATRCSGCGCVASSQSKIDFETQMWTCEVCGAVSKTDLSRDELASFDGCDFLVRMGAREQSKKLAVFCIDVSGSMSSTIEAPKNMVLLNMERATERRLAMERELAQFMEAGANQNFGRSNQVKFFSRLECVQASAHHAVSQLVKMLPDHIPVLVTFSSDVKLFNLDGSVTTKAGDALNDLNGEQK